MYFPRLLSPHWLRISVAGSVLCVLGGAFPILCRMETSIWSPSSVEECEARESRYIALAAHYMVLGDLQRSEECRSVGLAARESAAKMPIGRLPPQSGFATSAMSKRLFRNVGEVENWMDGYIVLDDSDDSWLSIIALYVSYTEWCQRQDLAAMPRTRFVRQLTARLPATVTSERRRDHASIPVPYSRGFRGIKRATEDQTDSTSTEMAGQSAM